MQKSKRSNVLSVLALLLLTNCISVPDVPLCTELSPSLGYCQTWISGKGQYVDNVKERFNGKTWDQIKNESVLCLAVECLAPIKSYIQNTCHQSKNCQNGIGSWQSTTGGNSNGE